MDAMNELIRDYILREFLPGENKDELSDSTPLITGGILDSIGTLKLLTFLETEFKLHLQASDANASNLNTVTDIVRFVKSREEESSR